MTRHEISGEVARQLLRLEQLRQRQLRGSEQSVVKRAVAYVKGAIQRAYGSNNSTAA